MVNDAVLDAVLFFRELSAPARRALAARAVVRSFAPRETLWVAGDVPRGLFVVLEGEVRAVSTIEGRQHVIHTEGPGGTLGDVPLFSGGRFPATTIASKPTRCLVVGRAALSAAITADPDLAFVLLERLARRVREVLRRLDGAITRSVRSRLATLILQRSQASGGTSFRLGSTQEAAAEEIGTVREVLVRELRRLLADGLITRVGRGRYAVADRSGLDRVAAELDA